MLLSPVRARAFLIVAVMWTRDAGHVKRNDQREANRAAAEATPNPRQLRAMQLLERGKVGIAPRVGDIEHRAASSGIRWPALGDMS